MFGKIFKPLSFDKVYRYLIDDNLMFTNQSNFKLDLSSFNYFQSFTHEICYSVTGNLFSYEKRIFSLFEVIHHMIPHKNYFF